MGPQMLKLRLELGCFSNFGTDLNFFFVSEVKNCVGFSTLISKFLM